MAEESAIWLKNRFSTFQHMVSLDLSLATILKHGPALIQDLTAIGPPLRQNWLPADGPHLKTLFGQHPKLFGQWILILGAALQPTRDTVMDLFVEALMFPDLQVGMEIFEDYHTITLYTKANSTCHILTTMIRLFGQSPKTLIPTYQEIQVRYRYMTSTLPIVSKAALKAATAVTTPKGHPFVPQLPLRFTAIQQNTIKWLTKRLHEGTLRPLLIQSTAGKKFYFCPELECIPSQPLSQFWTRPVVFLGDERAGKDTAVLQYCFTQKQQATLPYHVLIITAALSMGVWDQLVSSIFGPILRRFQYLEAQFALYEHSITICTYEDIRAHHHLSTPSFNVVIVDNSVSGLALEVMQQINTQHFQRIIYLAPGFLEYLEHIPAMVALQDDAMRQVLSHVIAGSSWNPAALVIVKRLALYHQAALFPLVPMVIALPAPEVYAHTRMYFRKYIQAQVQQQQTQFRADFDLLAIVRNAAGALQQTLTHGLFPQATETIICHQESCAVCLGTDVFIPTQIECGHLFCRPCIEEWCQQQSSCPLCRTRTHAPNWQLKGLEVAPPSVVQTIFSATKMPALQEFLSGVTTHVLICTQYACVAAAVVTLVTTLLDASRVLYVSEATSAEELLSITKLMAQLPCVIVMTPAVIGLTFNFPALETVVLMEPLLDCELRDLMARYAYSGLGTVQGPRLVMLTVKDTVDDIPNLWVASASLGQLLQIFQAE